VKRSCVRKKKEKGVYRKKEKGWDWKKVFGGWVGRTEDGSRMECGGGRIMGIGQVSSK